MIRPPAQPRSHLSLTTDTLPITIDVFLGPDEWNAGLRSDALAGLAATTKTLTPTWLYDDAGSVLYDAITRLPAYYPGLARNSRFSTGGPLEMVR
ncbi:MAG: L-histidine N(alpha)-methyltransferase [Ilumatobacteraceae bacterium]